MAPGVFPRIGYVKGAAIRTSEALGMWSECRMDARACTFGDARYAVLPMPCSTAVNKDTSSRPLRQYPGD